MKENKKRAFPCLEISDDEWDFFASKFDYISIPKGCITTQHGQTENYLTFLDHGIMRSFTSVDDRDRTYQFSFPGEFVSSYASFVSRAPSRIGIEALTECECWRITYDNLQLCYDNTELGNLMGRVFAEALFMMSFSREISMLTKSAEQRYIELLSTNPEWFRNIPLKHVASYLGITPQALSRIRARIF